MKPLPIDAWLGAIRSAVIEQGAAVVVAPPGAGKTTRVPLALERDLPPAVGVLMLEPRRVAARAAALRMAQETGTRVGGFVGHHVRFDRQAGDDTRILVVTEGLLTRRLQDDPILEGTGLVILDEFHERSMHADLGLALVAEIRRSLRPELRVVVMSATMDPDPVSAFLGGAPVIRCVGAAHPVEVHHASERDDSPVEILAARLTRKALAGSRGDILVFLPGKAEIARTARALAGAAAESGFEIVPLHGELQADAQDRALRPGERRRVVLSTNVAETSVTIEGVTGVVDLGLARRLRHDAAIGVDRLELRPISRASADQRAGRAGRLGPGQCFRAWTEARHHQLEEEETPELLRVDLAGPLIAIRGFGYSDPSRFPWFEAPDAAAVARAEALLLRLGAIEANSGRLTEAGDLLRRLPVHPRFARLLVLGHGLGFLDEAAEIAALLSERDLFAPGFAPDLVARSDVLVRLDALRGSGRHGTSRGDARTVLRVAAELRPTARRVLGPSPSRPASDQDLLKLLLSTFPDRVAKRRSPGSERALMTGGVGLRLAPTSVVRDDMLFVVVSMMAARPGSSDPATVQLASAIEPEWLESLRPGAVERRREASFDARSGRVAGKEVLVYDDLVLSEKTGVEIEPAETARILEAEVRRHPLSSEARRDDEQAWIARVATLAEALPGQGWPAIDAATIVELRCALCGGRRSLDEVLSESLLPSLEALLDHRQRASLDALAPETMKLPGGRFARIRYEVGRPPIVSATVQAFFGVQETPTIAGGRLRCLVELLAPSQRPVQLTADLRSFWKGSYALVRKDLRGRYPKHAWPEVPPGS